MERAIPSRKWENQLGVIKQESQEIGKKRRGGIFAPGIEDSKSTSTKKKTQCSITTPVLESSF